ncbi:MAG TPA: kynureninase [Sphingomonas sp.]|nr:kynureninase [Sphingomonas sp.]
MTIEDARAADAADPLRSFKARFRLPEGAIYLDGNSLGALPADTPARLAETIEGEWGRSLIRAWTAHGWMEVPARVGGLIAPLIGAEADEVVVADSTSVNLFKLAAAALDAQPERRVIVTEAGNFPTDLYILQGLERRMPDVELRIVPRGELAQALDGETALLLLTHVHYRTGERHSMAALTRAAHDAGALAIWDLSHSAGAIPVDVDGAGVDAAVGCGYKFLNGGPGAPSFLYIRRALQETLANPIQGWLGHAAPFAFEEDYAPAPGIARFRVGSPPVLGLAALEVGVRLMREADMAAIAAKSAALFDRFAALAAERCPELRLLTPADPGKRGSQISFAHPHGYEVMQALIERGVIGDFREPDVLRFGLTPLTLSHEDVWRAVDILADVLVKESWRDPRYAVRSAIT